MSREDLSGRAIVITGASSGFGKGAARAFAERGATLVLAARRGELLEELARECESRGGKALAVAADVSQLADVENLSEVALARLGTIDVWINNAGVGALGCFEDVPIELHEQVIATNLLGTLYGSWFAYRHFRSRGQGILINVASELGEHTVPYYASYAAAKHGVVGLGSALRQELDQNDVDGVHVCTVMPTAHDTPFFDHVANYTGREVEAPSPLHDPRNVVDALVRLVTNPKDEEIVGADGVVKIWMKRLMPGVEEKLAGRMMHKTQMERPKPAPPTAGAVASPMAEGTEVSAGRLERSRAG
jgi:short-subunit dehydrogenase